LYRAWQSVLAPGSKQTAEAISSCGHVPRCTRPWCRLARKGTITKASRCWHSAAVGQVNAFLRREISASAGFFFSVPPHPGGACAAGSLLPTCDGISVRSLHRVLDARPLKEIGAILNLLARKGRPGWMRQNLAFVERHVNGARVFGTLGQSFEISIPLTEAELSEPTFRAHFHPRL